MYIQSGLQYLYQGHTHSHCTAIWRLTLLKFSEHLNFCLLWLLRTAYLINVIWQLKTSAEAKEHQGPQEAWNRHIRSEGWAPVYWNCVDYNVSSQDFSGSERNGGVQHRSLQLASLYWWPGMIRRISFCLCLVDCSGPSDFGSLCSSFSSSSYSCCETGAGECNSHVQIMTFYVTGMIACKPTWPRFRFCLILLYCC